MSKQTATTAALALCALLDSCGGSDSQPTSAATREVAANQKISCGSGGTGGIEGTGVHNKLTGRITGIAGSDANTTVAVGSNCFAAGGASVYARGAGASLADLQVDQLITAEGQFGAQSGNYASSIYILQSGGSAQLQSVQELRIWDQKSAGDWDTANWGPDVMLAPSAAVLIDGVQVPAAGLTVDANEIALVTGVLTFDAQHNPGGLLTAGRLEIAHLLDGPIDALDLAHGRLIVLGLTVTLDGQTGLDPSLQVGMRVRVSGHPTASSAVAATLITRSDVSGDYLVTNFISAINPSSSQLQIGGLTVDYAAATLQNFPADHPRAGDHVRVEGRRSGATLLATSVSYISPELPGSPGGLASLAGIVTAVTSPSAVSVDGYAVTVTDAAIQACGTAPQLDTPATLDGTLQPSGDILADDFCVSTLTVATYKWVSVTGAVDAIDSQFGTLSILGFNVQPNSGTEFFDYDANKQLLPSDIKVGDVVMGRGLPAAVPNVLLSDRVWREAGRTPTISVWRGYVSYADPFIYVLGRPIKIPPDVSLADPLDPADCGPAINLVLGVDRGKDGSLTARTAEFEFTRC